MVEIIKVQRKGSCTYIYHTVNAFEVDKQENDRTANNELHDAKKRCAREKNDFRSKLSLKSVKLSLLLFGGTEYTGTSSPDRMNEITRL